MELTKTLSVERFNEFIRCLTNLKEVCNDADIKGGFLRQRTNNHTSVFEMDLRPVFDDFDIVLTNLKQKIELLKTFQGQEVEVTIVTPDDGSLGYYNFKDEHSSIKFITPATDFIDNTFMTEEELTGIFPLAEDSLILTKSLSQIITDRIKIVSNQFSIETINIKFNGETATMSASTPARDQSSNFDNDIMLDIVIENSTTNISNVAFAMDHETDIHYNMFKDPNQNVALNRFTTTIGDIDITVYSRSQIIEDDEG